MLVDNIKRNVKEFKQKTNGLIYVIVMYLDSIEPEIKIFPNFYYMSKKGRICFVDKSSCEKRVFDINNNGLNMSSIGYIRKDLIRLYAYVEQDEVEETIKKMMKIYNKKQLPNLKFE